MRFILIALSLALLTVNAARADPATLKHLLQERFTVAEDFELAGFAQTHCHGLRVIDGAVLATAAGLGFTEDDDLIHSPEYDFWAKRGQTNAKIGYEKSPADWCERMWHLLGPNHPPMIKRALLEKK